jgi:ubiquinone/menaquinone biosynthesis C-methylase UbiE
MSRFTDPQYLKTDQYKDSSNLDARVEIHKRFSTNPYGWMLWVFDHLLTLPANAKILELGCGPGYLWRDNAARIPATWDITLSDLSAGMIDSAWRNLVVTGRSYKFKEIDAQEIPFEDETFDAVIANHMLYHVPDRKQALKEMRRVLKDDGILFTATLGVNHMRQMWDWLERTGNSIKRETITSAFTLENGQEQLQEFFPRVEMTRYLDDLRVTDVSVMMAYIRSMTSTSNFQEDSFRSIERELAAEMSRNGEIFIEKAGGLFEARKK